MPSQEVLLNSREQYRKDVFQIPQLTSPQEREIEELARQGNDQAKQRLVESCLSYVTCIAWRYVPYLKHDDYLDIVSVGNLAIVECLEKSLTKANPSAYLRSVAKWEMLHYCYYHSELIERGANQEHMPEIYSLDSLFTPVMAEEQTTSEQLPVDRETIRSAIHKLSEKQQYVIMRHYGLDGDTPESLRTISRQLSSNPKATIAFYHWNCAMQRLQRLFLAETENNQADILAEAG
jgi:RNA polymerase sigma factor (sigma-70 family)